MGMTSEASEQWVTIEKKKRGKFKHAEERGNRSFYTRFMTFFMK